MYSSVSATDDPFKGIAASPFPEETRKVLLAPINDKDVEIKPDGEHSDRCASKETLFCRLGLIYLPEIKYRRILNAAFGPGGWALMPRGEVLQFQVRKRPLRAGFIEFFSLLTCRLMERPVNW